MSAVNSLRKFESCTGKKHTWPLNNESLCDYTSWALTDGNLQASTVKSYLSSINIAHKFRNMQIDTSSFLIKALLRGAENLSLYEGLAKSTRKVMTLPLLKLLAHQIAISDWKIDSKRVFWSACSVAFFGSCRMGELLPSSHDFNPLETLMWSDIKFRDEDSIIMHIKLDKAKNKQGSFIDLFKFENLCPVKALLNLSKHRPDKSGPVFQFESGTVLTQKMFNATVRKLLHPLIGKEAQNIAGHSFRAGIPSALANDPLAAKDSDIKKWGRWSSDTYMLYTRLKLEQKKHIFSKIVHALNKTARSTNCI